MKITDLKGHEKNPRRITKKQFNRLESTLKELGDLSGIVYNRANSKLVGGHMRHKVFESLNSKIVIMDRLKEPDSQGTVALGFVTDKDKKYSYREVEFTEEQHERAMLIANRAGGDWDVDMLANNWDAEWLEDEIGFEKPEFGMSADEPEATEGDDDVPAGAPPVTKMGDLYELGEHRLLCGDSTVATDVEKVCGDQSPSLMVTDPPYGVKYDPEWRDGCDLGVGERSKGKVKNDDRIDWSEAYSLFSGDVCYVWHAGKYTHVVAKNLEDCGFDIISQIIWAKQHFALSRGDYHWQHEPCWYAVRKGKNHQWQGKRDQATLWEIKNNNSFGNSNKEETWGHGTQKPLSCMQIPILNNSKEGQSVYDPFCGSGTTVIACEKNKRVCLALELDPQYCDMIVKRYVQFCKKNDIEYSVKRNGKSCGDFDA